MNGGIIIKNIKMMNNITVFICCFFLLSCGSNDFVINEKQKSIAAKDGYITRFDLYSNNENTPEYYEITWDGLGIRQKCIFLERIPKCYTILNENRDTLTAIPFVNNREYTIHNYGKHDATAITRSFVFK